MGWRLSLRTPARLMLILSASSLTYFSKVALSQCDSHGSILQYPWTIAGLHAIGLSLCTLPEFYRYVLSAMRAGRAVIGSSDLERSDPLDPTRYATALDYTRVALFGVLRCIICVLCMASLQYLQISHFLCLNSLLFSFVSVASFFRRKNFFRYHTVGAILGILGSALICLSVVLNITREDHPLPCSAPSGLPPPLLGTSPLLFGVACVCLAQALLAMLYCLEETFLSRVKIETQFFMGLQGIFGCFFICICWMVLRSTPAYLSKDPGPLAALFKLGHEDIAQGFATFVQYLPLSVSIAAIVAASCLSVVACVITTQHATATCRLALELTKTLILWGLGIYFNVHSIELKHWTLPHESWSSQSVVVALGLLFAAIGQAVYHRCASSHFAPFNSHLVFDSFKSRSCHDARESAHSSTFCLPLADAHSIFQSF